MQTPQDLDAQHSGELFPVNESCAEPQSLPTAASLTRDAANPASRNSGQDRGRNYCLD